MEKTEEWAAGILIVLPSGVKNPLVARLTDLATEVMKSGSAAAAWSRRPRPPMVAGK